MLANASLSLSATSLHHIHRRLSKSTVLFFCGRRKLSEKSHFPPSSLTVAVKKSAGKPHLIRRNLLQIFLLLFPIRIPIYITFFF